VWAAAALGHYNTDKLAGIVTPEISDQTEVWMDWVVNEDGVAANQTMVPFVPDPRPDRERSIVIHKLATNPADGSAGGRQACMPLVFPS
jgi:Cu/Zn superoxide dismutase